jgi:hypothetical protein
MTGEPEPEPYEEVEDPVEEIPPVVMQKLHELSNVLSEFGENWVIAMDLRDGDGGGSFYTFHGASTSPVWMRGASIEIQNAYA